MAVAAHPAAALAPGAAPAHRTPGLGGSASICSPQTVGQAAGEYCPIWLGRNCRATSGSRTAARSCSTGRF